MWTCASNPRWQGKKPVLLTQMTQKTFFNESSSVTHAGSHIWQVWVTSLTVLSVLRVPGNMLPKVKCTSCSSRLYSHASLRHPDGHTLWGGSREPAPPLPKRPPPLTFPWASEVTMEVKFHAWRCPGQNCVCCFSTLIAPGTITQPH